MATRKNKHKSEGMQQCYGGAVSLCGKRRLQKLSKITASMEDGSSSRKHVLTLLQVWGTWFCHFSLIRDESLVEGSY